MRYVTMEFLFILLNPMMMTAFMIPMMRDSSMTFEIGLDI